MSRPLKQLTDEIRQIIWPNLEQENLLIPHNHMFLEGLGELQKDVKQLQDDQCDVVEFCRTFYRCGLTIVPKPNGIIHRILTIPKCEGKYDWCRPVFFYQREFSEVDAWSRTLRLHKLADNDAPSRFPLGFQNADASTDSKHGRSRNGIYAIHNGNIHLAPWIQSNEAVVIEWKGIKPSTQWSDDDLIDDSPEFKKALKLFVQYAHERDFGTDPAQRSSLHENYDDALSELILQKREETRVREQHPVSMRHHKSHLKRLLETKPITVPECEPEKDFIFAHIGNNGVNNANSDAVAAAVRAIDDLEAVISGGGNLPPPNLIQSGLVYGGFGFYQLNTVAGAPYTIFFGDTEVSITNGVSIPSPGSGKSLTVVAVSTSILIVGVNGQPVTASAYAAANFIPETNPPGYDIDIGRNFSSLIFPYAGAYGSGADKNSFWPTIDDNDWLDALAKFNSFFSDLPNNGRYYDVCYGPVHFFFLDSSGSEPDGYVSNSKQGDWLRLKLITSTAKWKVVVESGPPYSSDSYAEKSNARWPYQAWGADLVLSGLAMNYERFSINGFPYIVNGLGGVGKDSSVTPETGSVVNYFANFGYGKLTANKTTLTYQFIAVDGTLVDTLTLT